MQGAGRVYGYRDTGIMLAAKANTELTPEAMDPSTDFTDVKRAMEKHLDDAEKRKLCEFGGFDGNACCIRMPPLLFALGIQSLPGAPSCFAQCGLVLLTG